MVQERADAARNRRAILRAAEELLRAEPEHVSIERVAAAAGVGKGTVFHRFGSRAGLLRALMEERVDALRVAIEGGPPPLGPGAPARERLIAMLEAVVELAERNIGLVTAHELALLTQKRSGEARQTDATYVFWHAHVAGLIAEARPDFDAELLGHVLLGSMHSEPMVELLRRGDGERVAAGLKTTVAALLA